MDTTNDTLPIETNGKDKRYLTTEEVAAYLSLDRTTIWRMKKEKKIPYIPYGKRTARYDKKKIDAWVEERTIKAKI